MPRSRRRRRLAAAAGLAALAAVVALVVLPGPGLPDVEQRLTELSRSLGPWTYALVGGLAFLETGAFVGLVVPGETAIVLGGVVAERGDVDLVPLLALVWAAAALGDLASFALGRRLGPRFLAVHGGRVGLGPDRLARVEKMVDRHGPKAVLIGRFVGLVRAVAPFLVGAAGLPLRRFLPWSLLGTAAWATLFTLIGFVFWRSFSQAADTAAGAALALALLAASAVAAHALRARRRGADTLAPASPCSSAG
jgi:membrane-associated protein